MNSPINSDMDITKLIDQQLALREKQAAHTVSREETANSQRAFQTTILDQLMREVMEPIVDKARFQINSHSGASAHFGEEGHGGDSLDEWVIRSLRLRVEANAQHPGGELVFSGCVTPLAWSVRVRMHIKGIPCKDSYRCVGDPEVLPIFTRDMIELFITKLYQQP